MPVPDRGTNDGERGRALVAAGAVSIAAALGVSAGFRDASALGLVTAGVLLAVAGGRRLSARGVGDDRVTVLVLAAGAALGILRQLVPGAPASAAAIGTDAYRASMFGVIVVLASYGWSSAPAWAHRARFPVLAALAIVAGALVIVALPRPRIDVWYLQQLGAQEMLAGNNPYAAWYPNLYGPRTPFLAPALLSPDGWRITAYPYTPAALLLGVPGALAGDVRWSLLATIVAAGWLVRALGRGTIVAELAATAFIFQPQGFWVLERAWTEPFVLATVLVAALAIRRRTGWVGPGLAMGVAVATKQYVPLLVAPLWLTLAPGVRWRTLVSASLAIAVLFLPFLAWNPSGLYRGVVEFQLLQPFRFDALSWPALVGVVAGAPEAAARLTLLALPLAAATLAWTLVRGVTLARGLAGAAAAWTVFVLFSKQAFCNYYWLAVGLLCAAVAAASTAQTSNVSEEPHTTPHR